MRRQSRPARHQTGAAYLTWALALILLLTACDLPGPTPTIPPSAKTAVANYSTPTPRIFPTATLTVPPSPARVARTPTPGKNSFVATIDQPCRPVRYTGLIPEKKSSVETVGQVYRCFLLHYVDHATLDHQVLLNGAWAVLEPLGKGRFTPEDVAPLALTGDREADWQVFAGRFTALTEKGKGTVDASLLARTAIAGMADSLQDNHVAYLEPKHWRSVLTSELGLAFYPSAGFELATDLVAGKFYLYHVFPNTPAARAGLRRGDIIEKVGGKPAGRGVNNQALYDLLVGLPGTGDTLEFTRPATGQTTTVIIGVADVEVPPITTERLSGGIGYIHLRYFGIFADEEFDDAIASLRGSKAIIFDVRQNPGGSVNALQHILSYFTHSGPLAITIDDQGKQESVDPDPNVPLLGVPWVVLCDSDSASSSDITAAVAKARGGYLIGTKSAGALGGALFYELEDGSALEVTVVRVLGPDGEEINNIGVTPDQIVPLTPADLSAGNDTQLQAAIAYLKR